MYYSIHFIWHWKDPAYLKLNKAATAFLVHDGIWDLIFPVEALFISVEFCRWYMFVPLEIQKVLNFEMFGTFKFYAKLIVSNLSIKEYASLVHPFSSFLWVCLNKKKNKPKYHLLSFIVFCELQEIIITLDKAQPSWGRQWRANYAPEPKTA